jgi:DNA-directed RNA polymerase subunit M/transcription elongation factor TFIIS
MTSLCTVVLSTKGEVRKANVALDSDGTLTMEAIQKYLKKKEQPERICYYEYDHKIIFVFGYSKGKKGTENKTELPEPYAGMTLFGDALITVSLNSKWEQPIPFTVEQWNTFYQEFGGEEEEEEEDEDEVLSEDATSVKDDFEESDSEKDLLPEKDEEIEEEVPVVTKRRRAPVYAKVDTSALKEEISIESEPESYILRTQCLASLSFLEDIFSKDDIRSLERGIFEATFQYAQKQYIARNWKTPVFQEVYRQILRSILSNLHPKSPVNNTRLLSRVQEGEFTLYEIPFMSSYDMFPERWFALKDKLLQREQKILEGNKSRATDQFKCRRCQKRECTYYELQTRSADEPMTIFITCLNKRIILLFIFFIFFEIFHQMSKKIVSCFFVYVGVHRRAIFKILIFFIK